MLNFELYNPTNLVFGKGQIEKLSTLVPQGAKILITYGGGSIFKNGIHAQVVENLKGFAGQVCQKTGNWWSPANQLQSRYFEQGEVFPKVDNNSWGETIWYLEVTNKK